MAIFKFKKKEAPKDILMVTKEDRRLLSYVKDDENIRTKLDRRSELEDDGKYIKNMGDYNLRYIARYDVKIKDNRTKAVFVAKSKDISATGMLLEIDGKGLRVDVGDTIKVKFTIKPGTMPEGFESKIKMKAEIVRVVETDDDGNVKVVGVKFNENLYKYIRKRRGILFFNRCKCIFIYCCSPCYAYEGRKYYLL